MKRVPLGKTGLEVSPLCIGTWQLGGPLFFDGKPDGHPDPGQENVIRMIHELGDLGINHIDTAEQYSAGESERRVGEALKDRRDHWIISTKFGYRVSPNGDRIDDASPNTILPSLEGSLKRLQTDCIDIYLYHCAPEIADLEAGKAILDQAKADGKIRAYGISTNNIDLLKAMAERDMLDVAQFATNLLWDQPEIRQLAGVHNLGTQVRGVMAQGRLSGKYFHVEQKWRADDNRSDWCKNDDYRRFSAFEKLIPAPYESMAQVAIRWILDQPEYHTICMGAKNSQDYKSAIAALDLPPLTQETRQKLEACAASLS